jgi:hypothetical protein
MRSIRETLDHAHHGRRGIEIGETGGMKRWPDPLDRHRFPAVFDGAGCMRAGMG